MKKLLTRTLMVLLIAILGYFAFISSDVQIAPIEKSDRQAAPLADEEMRGEDVRYKSYDIYGNEKVSGESRKVTQRGEDDLLLEDGLELKLQIEGKNHVIKADAYGQDELGRQIMTAEPGNRIHLSVDDLTIETQGPLIYGADGVFTTEAEAQFAMGDASGQSRGLRYKPETFLELLENCRFAADGPETDLRISADSMVMDQTTGKAVIRQGALTAQQKDGSDQNQLTADEIELLYSGGHDGETFKLIEANVLGEPAKFLWNEGDLASSLFFICFDSGGKWISELITGIDAQFTTETDDGYVMYGRGGQLSLWLEEGSPRELRGSSNVHLEGSKNAGPRIRLTGEQGLETLFRAGKAYSTMIFGAPTFEYDGQEGTSGSLRLSHNERNIIFSNGAELFRPDPKTRIKADQILLTDWDAPDTREINAFAFVEIAMEENSAEAIQAFGDELKLTMADGDLRLAGSPARLDRRNLTINAATIEVDQIDRDLYDMQAVAPERGTLNLVMATEEGVVTVQAKTLSYESEADRLTFDDVIKAVLPGRGELSAKSMKAKLKDRGERKVVERLEADQDVLFTGALNEDEETRPVHCQADAMRYDLDGGTILFTGVDRDVVLNHPSGVFRGRELTYHLGDGSIRGDSDKHGTTRTTINLKGQKNP